MPSPKILSVFAIFAFVASFCQAASYHKASPPNLIVLSYPDGDLTAKQILQVGADGAGTEVSGNYYGFAWNTSISIVLPNGTHVSTISVSNSNPGPNSCAGAGAVHEPSANVSTPIAYAAFYNETTNTGTYTILWNVTYGTTTDPTIANQTACDRSRLSYESFTFNKSINVISPTADVSPMPVNTKEARTFEPTGFIMTDSNSAGVAAGSMSLMAMGILVVSFLTV